jgi:hypothetical protein
MNLIQFTQGDNAVLSLTAQDALGNPINLTGASFSTQILGANGQPVNVFPNGQHAIVSASLGTFTLTLSAANTTACGLGNTKDIVTAITISGNVTYFRGSGILTVFPPVPMQ